MIALSQLSTLNSKLSTLNQKTTNMKKLKNKWLIWTSKMFVSFISMLGFSSCFFQPSMYGVPRDGFDTDSTSKDSTAMKEFEAMYGGPTVTYQNDIDVEGVEIDINQD